jgi:hypothetical protein
MSAVVFFAMRPTGLQAIKQEGDRRMKLTARRVMKIYFVVLFGAVAFSSSSHAVSTNPCARDIEQFWSKAKPGNDGILKCLESNAKKLSPACRDYEGPLDGIKGADGKPLDAKTKKTKFPYVYR